MGSSYFTPETDFPFAGLPAQDLREMDADGNFVFPSKNSFGKEILIACLPHTEMDSLMLLPSCQAVCLAGVSGVGKRSLALSYAGTVMRTLGWKLLYVKGRDLAAAEEQKQPQNMQKLFQKASAQPCVLILETNGLESVWENAAACIAALPPELSLTVLLVEDDISVLKPEWTHDLLLLYIPLPDTQDRENFFARRENVMMRRKDSFGNSVPTFRELADESEGLTFTELKQVVQLIRFQMKLRAIREHRGDPEEIRNEYVSNRFCYDKRMFQDAVQKVRSAKEAAVPEKEPLVLPAGMTAPPQNTDPFSILTQPMTNTLPFTSGQEGRTEDQISEQNVLSRLRIPPNPNA